MKEYKKVKENLNEVCVDVATKLGEKYPNFFGRVINIEDRDYFVHTYKDKYENEWTDVCVMRCGESTDKASLELEQPLYGDFGHLIMDKADEVEQIFFLNDLDKIIEQLEIFRKNDIKEMSSAIEKGKEFLSTL